MGDTPARADQATRSPYVNALIAGGLAGTIVDLSLHPIDTIKTRLQSSSGFGAAGGLRGVYKGVGSAFVGSAPSGALFFVTYERTKDFVKRQVLGKDFAYADPISHIVAGSLGETAACAARVPTEVVKQRVQASQYKSSIQSFMHIFASKGNHGLLGSIRALYRGGSATLLRDIPFTMIQFPIWEALKTAKQRAQGRSTVTGLESAAFGSVSGAVAAILTTPLDVIKTRTILASERRSMRSTVMMIVQTDGPRALLAGVLPRTIWISAGGAVFLGSYQLILNNLQIR